ncbi:Proprotein convertase P-domain protein [Phycisphaerae bacterium RAS1]|nr:Proprotein convertase P-domain protein [Phycisphaerae bacterium RAS1]
MKKFVGILGLAALAAPALAQPQKNFLWTGSLAIADNDGPSTVTITVPADPGGLNTVGDVNVDTIIAHTWQGDMNIVVSHGGTSVNVYNRPGFAGTGFGFSTDNVGNPTTGVAFVWDDEATQGPYDTPVVAINNPVGNWRPESPLSAFDGMDKRGDWTFTVTDHAAGDVGTIRQFSLAFTNVPEPAALALLALGGMLLRRR